MGGFCSPKFDRLATIDGRKAVDRHRRRSAEILELGSMFGAVSFSTCALVRIATYWMRSMREHRTCVGGTEVRELRIALPSDFPQGDAEAIVRHVEPSARVAPQPFTVDELLSKELIPPAGVGIVGLADMDLLIENQGRREDD
jgi:hypothetical protein